MQSELKYRLYIDEVGNPGLKCSRDPNHRYLSLTGIILELEYVSSVFQPELEQLKHKYFHSHPDDPLILHRKELVNKKPPFTNLRDPSIETEFNQELLSHISTWEYTVITAVIDKLQHLERYQVWQFDPYHYCLKVLVERYVRWLNRRNVCGDVLSESREGKEDLRLKDSFERVYNEGSEWVPLDMVHAHLTSRQLKVKSKAMNIAGLQLADLIAHPSYKVALARRNGDELPTNFGGQIGAILIREKYDRGQNNRIDGWGIKWLP